MNKKILFVFLFLVFIFVNLKGLFSFNIYDLPLGLGPYEGETDIFVSYGLGIDIARYSDNEISIIRGGQYLSFSGSKIDINIPSFTTLPSNPVIEFYVNFFPKVPRSEIRFASVNITYEIKTNIPIGYVEVSFINDNDIRRYEGLLPSYVKVSRNVTVYTGEYQLRIRVFILSLGGPAAISFNYIKQFAITNFVKSNKHEMYFTNDFRKVIHNVELPISYDSSKWDDFYLTIVYPKYYNLTGGTFGISTYSFKDWLSYEKGEAKYLYSPMPFGKSASGILYLNFISFQSIYFVSTYSSFLLKADMKYKEIEFKPALIEERIFIEGDSLTLFSVNLDFKIVEQPSFFIYIIKDPDGNKIITSSFSKVTLNRTKDVTSLINKTISSPLDYIVFGSSDIKLDFINGKYGEWKIIVISISKYNLGINETSFMVYNFKFNSAFVEFSSNFGFKGNFSFSSDYKTEGSLWKGSYLLFIDPSLPEDISTRYFKVINSTGVSSIGIFRSLINLTDEGPKIKDIATLGFVTINFVILNNSTNIAFINKIDLELYVFDISSKVSVNFSDLGEISSFTSYESRLYFLYLIFGISKEKQKGYLITPLAVVKSTISNKNVTLVFPTNKALYNPLQYKVLSIKIKVGNNEAISNYIILYPKKAKINIGKILGIFETQIDSNGKSYFELNETVALKISDSRKIEAYALAYTKYYGTLVEKIFEDNIEIKGYLNFNSEKIVEEEGKEIKLNLFFKSYSNRTAIKFDLKVYIDSKLINDTYYVLAPSQSLNITITFKMPKTSGEILKIKSNMLKSIYGLIELENPSNINEEIIEFIPYPVREIITEYISEEYLKKYLVYIIIGGIIILIALALLIRKIILLFKKES